MSADKEVSSEELNENISKAEHFKNEANAYFKSKSVRLFAIKFHTRKWFALRFCKKKMVMWEY